MKEKTVMQVAYECPACKEPLDSITEHYTNRDEGFLKEPGRGDLAVCAECGAALIFSARGLELLSEERIKKLPFEVKLALGDLQVRASNKKLEARSAWDE